MVGHPTHAHEKVELLGKEPKAVLVLDNCSAHPDPENLMSDDGKIYALFLPANVIALIQPIDQGVIEIVKKKFRKLLQKLIIEDDCGTSIADFVKRINLKVVAGLIHESWNEINKEILRKSWRKILPIKSSCVSPLIPLLAELYQLVDNGNEITEANQYNQVLYLVIVHIHVHISNCIDLYNIIILLT